MRKFLLMLPLLGLVAACDQMSTNQQVGTAGGAIVGALVTPGNPIEGAAIGGAIGLAAGSMIGHTTGGRCLYQRPDGTRYTAACR